jgi:hypothetical protein
MATRKLGPEFMYDLSEFRKVDPNLVHYEEAAAVPTGMDEPRGIFVDRGIELLVAGDRVVRTFDLTGERIGEFATVTEPQRVAARRKDGIYYLAMADHVEVYSDVVNRRSAWQPAGPKSVLTCIAVADEDVFVAEAGAREVLHYNTRGELLNRISGKVGPDDQGLIVPSPYFDVAVAGKDRLWIANPGRRRVEQYAFDGTMLQAWGKASPKIEFFCG